MQFTGSDRAINCFFLWFFILLVTEFGFEETIFLLFQKLIYRADANFDVNVTKLHWGVFQKILFHPVFLPLKGSLYTSSSASLDVT